MNGDYQNLKDILCCGDVARCEQSLKYFSKAQKTIFAANLASEIIAQQIPPDTLVQSNFVDHCLSSITERIRVVQNVEALPTVIKWLKNKTITARDVINVGEVRASFFILADHLTTDAHFETAAKFLQKIVEQVDVIRYMNFESEGRFFNNLVELRLIFPTLNRCKATHMCKLFTAVGEKLVQKSECNPQRLLLVIQALIDFADHRELVELTFSFWQQFAKSIKIEQKPHFQAYVEQFLLKLAKNSAQTNIGSFAMEIDDKGRDLIVFRASVTELIEKLISFINPQRTFEFFFLKLQENDLSLHDKEACLFIINCIAAHIDYAEDTLVPQLIYQILQLDETSNTAIAYMSIKVLKGLSQWISVHHQTHLTGVLNLLLKFLLIEGAFASVAADAMGELCCVSKAAMQAHISHLFELIKVSEKFMLHTDAEMNLVKGVARVVFSLPCDQQLRKAMKHLCEIILAKIFANRDGDVVLLVDRLAEVYHNIPPVTSPNSCTAQVFMENWPTLSQMLDYYRDNAAVMKKIVECIRCAVYNLCLGLHPILDVVIKQLLRIYCEKNYHFILRFMAVVIERLGGCASVMHGLFIAFEGFSVATFNGLHDEREISAESMDEYFQLATTCVNKMPLLILKSPLIMRIIDFTINACTFNDKNVNKSAMKFLISVIACNCCHQDIEVCVLQAMTLYSRQIISTLIMSSAFVFDPSLLTEVGEIFYAFKVKSSSGFRELLIEAIKAIPARNLAGRPMVHADRLNQIVNSLTRPNATKQEMISELTVFKNLFR